jgi:hypothetical protein
MPPSRTVSENPVLVETPLGSAPNPAPPTLGIKKNIGVQINTMANIKIDAVTGMYLALNDGPT